MNGPTITRMVGRAHDLHHRDLGDDFGVFHLVVDRPALVLGSAQSTSGVDLGRAERAGVDIVSRRSGGGAVFVDAASVLWVDVVLPRTDPRWVDDVSASFDWLGDAWITALDAVGIRGVHAHSGAMVTSPYSRRVCFAGVGPGECLLDGQKLVGMAQRRTRNAARFQTMAVLDWQPDQWIDLLRWAPAERADVLVELTTGVASVADVAAPGASGTALRGRGELGEKILSDLGRALHRHQ